MRRHMQGMLGGLLVLGLGAGAVAQPHTTMTRLERLYHDLILDQPLDRTKLDRLVEIALEDDLVVTPKEASFLNACVAKGYDDPTGEPPPEIAPTFDHPVKGWLARVQKLLATVLREGLSGTRGPTALRELTGLAWREDLRPEDRQDALTLIDNARQIDTVQRSRDAFEAIALIMTNPEEARRDQDRQQELARLARQANTPYILYNMNPSTASVRPGP